MCASWLLWTPTVVPGAQVLLTDPSYPCNRHFVSAFDGEPVGVPVGPDTRFQMTPELLARHWGPRTRGTLLASPANPTGTAIPPADLAAIVALVRERGGFLAIDEIYPVAYTLLTLPTNSRV